MEGATLNTAEMWPNVRKVLEDFGEHFIEAYRDNMALRDAIASGKLANSLSFEIASGASFLAVDVSLLDYWYYVEKGRKPGKFPPISKIERWIKVRRIVPRAYNGRVPTTKQLAFLIARKIALFGTKPRPIFAETLDAMVAQFEWEIEQAVTADIEQAVDIELLTL